METKWNVTMGPTVVHQNVSLPSSVDNSNRRDSKQLRNNDHATSPVSTDNTSSQRKTTNQTARTISSTLDLDTGPSAPPLQSCDDVSHYVNNVTQSGNKSPEYQPVKNNPIENTYNNLNGEISVNTRNTGKQCKDANFPNTFIFQDQHCQLGKFVKFTRFFLNRHEKLCIENQCLVHGFY